MWLLFLALHSNTLWDKPSSPLAYLQVIFVLDGAAPDVTLVTVVLGQGTKHSVPTWMPRSFIFFLATTTVMAEESIA